MLCFYTLGGPGSSPSSALVSFCEQICFPVVWAGATALLPWQSAAASALPAGCAAFSPSLI